MFSELLRVTGVNITKSLDGYRHLTVGRSLKNKLFWDAIECYKSHDLTEAQMIKGMQSFILSIEKEGYEKCYSEGMLKKVHYLGFDNLKSLIDSL